MKSEIEKSEQEKEEVKLSKEEFCNLFLIERMKQERLRVRAIEAYESELAVKISKEKRRKGARTRKC